MNIRAILDKYFDGVKCYVRGDGNGVWIETECMPIERSEEIKNKVGELLYEIKKIKLSNIF